MGTIVDTFKIFFRYFYCNIEMVKTAEQQAKILEVRANVKANGGVYKPTGKARGAPRLPDELKKPKVVYVPTGKPTGRRKLPPGKTKKGKAAAQKQRLLELQANAEVYKPTGIPRGRKPHTV